MCKVCQGRIAALDADTYFVVGGLNVKLDRVYLGGGSAK